MESLWILSISIIQAAISHAMANPVEFISTILAMVGVLLIAIPRIEGMYVMFLAQMGWTVFGYQEGHQFFLVQSLFMIAFNFFGLYNWRKKKIGFKPKKEDVITAEKE